MARVRYVQDPSFEAEVLSSPPVRAWVEGLTRDVAQAADELVAYRYGHLEGGIEPVVAFDGARGAWVGRVISKDFKTIWLEFGTKNTRAQPFLRPAIERVVPGATTVSR